MNAVTSPVKRISVWSGPRNVSTALMYSFRQRSDTIVVDEPLYGHYLEQTDAPHPGKDEVLLQMETDGKQVVRDILLGQYDKPVVVFKNMAHHITGLDKSFLGKLHNVLLVRNPSEMLPSLAQELPELTLRDTGLQEQVGLLETILASGETPIVLGAKRLLENPERVLRDLCRLLELPFEPAMLAWPEGPKPEDGVWAKYWYKNVHASSTFSPYRPKTTPFPDPLKPLLEICIPLYAKLQQYAL